MNFSEHTLMDVRFAYSHPLYYRRHPTSIRRSTSFDSSARHRQTPSTFRYVDAQIRNRLELMRLDERRRTLELQRRDATSAIDRNKRRFAEEMANVGRRTSSSYDGVLGGGRERAATAAAGARRGPPSHADDVGGLGVTPALAALQLRQRSPQTSGRVDLYKDPGETGVGLQSTVITAAVPRPRCAVSGFGGTRRVSATTVRQDADIRGAPPIATSNHHVPPNDAVVMATASVATAAESPSPGNGGVVTSTGSELARWRRDLMREAPPALFGCRRSLTFHVVMSQAERRRRLEELQCRQMAPLVRRRQCSVQLDERRTSAIRKDVE